MKNRTPAYWQTRALLAVGVIATVVVLMLSLEGLMHPPVLFGGGLDVLGLPVNFVIALVSLGLGLVGFVWMLRIFRGPRGELPVWRYRDR